jgi:hypothetical protein
LLAIVCLLGLNEIATAESSLRGARVVWVRGDRIYVASPDSVALEPGMILTFTDRGKKVATGEVTAVHDREMIVAKLTSGSLVKVKHPDKLQITADRPVLRAPPLLRVGYPAAGRKNLLFECSYQSLDSSLGAGADRHSQLQRFYDSEMLDSRTHRLVRDSTVSVVAPWPDTLLVRLFDEVADEEIALERGDLDVAVFWPGEASAHIREVTGWKRWEGGIGARGQLTAAVRRRYQSGIADPFHNEELRALERLNHELFRGDLLPVPRPGMSPSSTLGRFKVDVSLPGHDFMEQFLNRAIGHATPVDTARVVQLSYHEIWPTVPVIGDLPEDYWLVVRCPVISRPKLQPYLHAIDTEALANLFQCIPPPRKP